MGDKDDIFVKRVDFEMNNNQSENILLTNGEIQNDVEKSDDVKKRKSTSCTTKFCTLLDKCGIKAALSHVGLLLGLGAYCLGGGWVIKLVFITFPPFQLLWILSTSIHLPPHGQFE